MHNMVWFLSADFSAAAQVNPHCSPLLRGEMIVYKADLMSKRAWFEEDAGKIISWKDNKVRCMIFYYLFGVVLSLYIMMMVEWLVGWPFDYVLGLITTAFIIPFAIVGICSYCASRGWLKGLI